MCRGEHRGPCRVGCTIGVGRQVIPCAPRETYPEYKKATQDAVSWAEIMDIERAVSSEVFCEGDDDPLQAPHELCVGGV